MSINVQLLKEICERQEAPRTPSLKGDPRSNDFK